MTDNFFIGWQSANDLKISKWVKLFAIFIFIGLMGASYFITRAEKGFGDGVFEYGILTEIEGTYFDKPYPTLVYQKGDETIFALLFDFGKMGAQHLISKYEKNNNVKLNGKIIKIKGTRIYRNDHHATELSNGVESIISIIGLSQLQYVKSTIGKMTLTGEIADPKCFLGVMKPGYAKPHRSCAILCISGGIPPLLKTTSNNNSDDYFILANQNGEAINDQVLEYVADVVRLCGTAYTINGWKVLEVDLTQDIQRLKRHWEQSDVVMCK